MKYHMEYKKIMLQAPDIYKLNYSPVSLTNLQILACLKIYIEKDNQKDGWIKSHEMVDILQNCLGFRCSKKEIEKLLHMEYGINEDNIANEKVNFSMLIQVVDILKREKLVLIELGSNLNYLIFLLLISLIVLYTGFFYSFKS